MTSATAAKARILTDKPAPGHDAGMSWQRAMREAITDPAELLCMLGLDEQWLPGARRAAGLFGLRVPRGYVARIRRGDPYDPLLRQILPLTQEFDDVEGFVDDAVGDLASLRGQGLLQKYHGRALLITTGACAVHCRFCFRRNFPYGEQLAARNDWQQCLEAIRHDESIEEVILSGGDPLSLSDDKLAALVDSLDSIPHLRRLRIHTRQPIVLPERVDKSLLNWLSHGRLQRIVVLHCNHSNELDTATTEAITELGAAGAILLNQAVLLRGVNDNILALKSLSEELFKIRVLPYYLHLLDRVRGTAHFEVEEERARSLMRQLAAQLPGYLVPRLVREEMGEPNKSHVSW